MDKGRGLRYRINKDITFFIALTLSLGPFREFFILVKDSVF